VWLLSTSGQTDVVTTAARPYHHGELRPALLEQGLSLARAGGPSAVQLRDAARRVGVSHNAGYRHFADRDAFLDEVASRAVAELADTMDAALARVPQGLPAAARAAARLEAVGSAYLEFALAEPGLFRTAFATRRAPEAPSSDHVSRGRQGRDPYEILIDAIDGLAAAGLLSDGRRPDSEIVAWSAVHGLATLLLDGPLRGSPPTAVTAMWARVSDAVLRGL
jgi:AcrR family transcriptional regulator